MGSYVRWTALAVAVVVAFLFYQSQGIRRAYATEAMRGLKDKTDTATLTMSDIQALPTPVQKYLNHVGVVGKPKVENVRVAMQGQFNIGQGWSEATISQYDFFGSRPGRLSLMSFKVKGLPILALDTYIDGKGSMLGKIAGLMTIIQGTGPEMDQSEAAVLLSEMCTTPATLIDPRISWETIDPLTVRATLNDNGCEVSGLLRFNDKGELTEFRTEDKLWQAKDGSYQKVPWSVVCGDYQEINGLKLSTYAEAIWHFPEGDSCYGKLHFTEFEYNCGKFR